MHTRAHTRAQVAAVAAAFARTRTRAPQLAAAVSASAAAHLPRFSPVHIANVLWALATLRSTPDRWLLDRACAVLLRGGWCCCEVWGWGLRWRMS